MCNSTIRAGCSAHPAFLTLHGINMCTLIRHRDGSEVAAVLTGFSETETAVVRYGIGRDGALFTGRIDDLNDIAAFTTGVGIFVTGKTNSSAENLSFLIDAAAENGFGTGRELSDQTLFTLFVYIILPGKPREAFNNPVF